MMNADAVNARSRIPDSCCFVIFGVTGDLAHRLVIPALYNLEESGLLPEKFCIVGVTRTETQSKTLKADLMKGLEARHPRGEEGNRRQAVQLPHVGSRRPC